VVWTRIESIIWSLFTVKVIDYRFRFLQSIRSPSLHIPSVRRNPLRRTPPPSATSDPDHVTSCAGAQPHTAPGRHVSGLDQSQHTGPPYSAWTAFQGQVRTLPLP
jgi:hypothetical protein